jgi:hypothetical protein
MAPEGRRRRAAAACGRGAAASMGRRDPRDMVPRIMATIGPTARGLALSGAGVGVSRGPAP